MKKKHSALLMFLVVLSTIGVFLIVHFSRITLNRILYQKGITITNQTPISIEIIIDKSKLLKDIDFNNMSSQQTKAIYDGVIYQTDTTAFYLSSISYANDGTEWLSLDFNIKYYFPKEGKIIYNCEVKSENGIPFFSFGVNTISKQVRDSFNTFENAVSIHGAGPKSFSVYLRTDVYLTAQNKIIFTVDGFNEISYISNL